MDLSRGRLLAAAAVTVAAAVAAAAVALRPDPAPPAPPAPPASAAFDQPVEADVAAHYYQYTARLRARGGELTVVDLAPIGPDGSEVHTATLSPLGVGRTFRLSEEPGVLVVVNDRPNCAGLPGVAAVRVTVRRGERTESFLVSPAPAADPARDLPALAARFCAGQARPPALPGA